MIILRPILPPITFMKNMINNSFDSIDRLMEFGMGLAVAQQMIATMNHTMREMEIGRAHV